MDKKQPEQSKSARVALYTSVISGASSILVFLFGEGVFSNFPLTEMLKSGITQAMGISFLGAGVIAAIFFIIAKGPQATMQKRINTLIIVVLMSCLLAVIFWDVFTTWFGLYAIFSLRSAGRNPLASTLPAAIGTLTIAYTLLSAAFIFSRKNPLVIALYIPTLLAVLMLDFWTSLNGNAYFIWNISNILDAWASDKLDVVEWVALVSVSASVSISSVIFSFVWSSVITNQIESESDSVPKIVIEPS